MSSQSTPSILPGTFCSLWPWSFYPSLKYHNIQVFGIPKKNNRDFWKTQRLQVQHIRPKQKSLRSCNYFKTSQTSKVDLKENTVAQKRHCCTSPVDVHNQLSTSPLSLVKLFDGRFWIMNFMIRNTWKFKFNLLLWKAYTWKLEKSNPDYRGQKIQVIGLKTGYFFARVNCFSSTTTSKVRI